MLDINTVIRKISDLGYMRVLVEGGSKLSASLLNENLIDEIAWFRASKIMGNKGINAISNLDIDSIENLKKSKKQLFLQLIIENLLTGLITSCLFLMVI